MTNYIFKHADASQPNILVRPLSTNGTVSPDSNTLHPQAVTASTSLILVGKGLLNYGEEVQNNFLYLLENFAAPVPPLHPTIGQLWYERAKSGITYTPTLDTLRLYDGTTFRTIVVNGYLTTSLDVTGQSIINVPTPTSADHATNKEYVDTTFVYKSGDTMSGFLTLNVDPVSPLHAATKQYVDAQIEAGIVAASPASAEYVDAQDNLRLLKAGDTMTGVLHINGGGFTLTGATAFDAGGASLTNLGSPTIDTDAATKQYVDLSVGGGTVTDGMLDALSGELTLHRFNTTDVVIANVSPLVHQHGFTDVVTDVYGGSASVTPSIIRDYLPENVTTTTQTSIGALIDILDQAAHTVTSPLSRYIIPGTGGNTITLPFKYVVNTNRLLVYEDGIKQYATERAVATVKVAGAVSGMHSSGLTPAAYAFNITVDGALTSNVAVDLSAELTPIHLTTVTQYVDRALNTPGHQDIVFSGSITGASASGLAAGTSYTATITVDGVAYAIYIADGAFVPTITDLITAVYSAVGDVILQPSIVGGNAIRITTSSTASYSSISIVDVSGPGSSPLFASLTLFSSIAAAVPGTTKAVVKFLDDSIRIISPTTGITSNVTIAPPTVGTDLFASITGATITNQSITAAYAYTEVGVPHRFGTQVTFTNPTNGAKVYEFLVIPANIVTPSGALV